ncbi:MAG: ThuA domain-containing protein [Candidatus Sumerlaeota bacterium]
MPDKQWMNKRQRCIHMTIRDIDCKDFDVDDMINRFKEMHVSLFSFFCGGYVTTYPTSLQWQRISPWLEGRDLTGEILKAAHENGMVAFPMMDLGELPVTTAEANPDWASRKPDGSFYVKSDGIVSSCPLGGYVRKCSKDLLRELIERYGDQIDGIKFGGASYGFAQLCHCDNCKKIYKQDTGKELPDNPDAGGFPEYERWKQDKMKETVRYLVDVVHEFADIPVMGNSIWELGKGRSIDDLARDQDFVQVEIQTRYYFVPDERQTVWERFTFPTETTRYISQLSKRPPWVVTSYFLAWPWRRVAVPWNEQKIFLAQVSANGGSPMVNLSGGPPKVHQDQRGFRAIKELYGFMDENSELYENDRSGATVALISSNDTGLWAKYQPESHEKYMADLHAFEDVMNRRHIPFDIWDVDNIEGIEGGRYATLVLPAARVLTIEQAAQIKRLVDAGAGLVADITPGMLAPDGQKSDKALLDDLLGVASRAEARKGLDSPHAGQPQAYLKQGDEHAILEGLPCDLFAFAGSWFPIEAKPDVTAALRKGPAFRVFPEGMSYPDHPDTDEPMALCRDPEAGGRTVYFPFNVGHVLKRTAHPDYEKLIAQAIRWTARGNVPLDFPGRYDVLASLRLQDGRQNVHLINTAGRERLLDEYTPQYDIEFKVKTLCQTARLASTGEKIESKSEEGWLTIQLPRLVDYDIISIE